MSVFAYILFSSFFISLISFVGGVLFFINSKKIQKYLLLIVSFAAGSFLGGAFFHLIPESFAKFSLLDITSTNSWILNPSYYILFGILTMYFIEKTLHWHHHHDLTCKSHILSSLTLIGGAFHRFVDGILISSTFLVNIHLGLIVTMLIIFHKIPQEIGNVAILIHSSYSKFKALFLNYLSSVSTILGAIFSYLVLHNVENLLILLLSFTAGGFIYIALADIIPELQKGDANIILINLTFILGLILSFSLKFLE